MDPVNKVDYHATVYNMGLLEKIWKISKNSLEKKLLNSQSDLGQTFLATALTWSSLPSLFQLRLALPGLRLSPRLATTRSEYSSKILNYYPQ